MSDPYAQQVALSMLLAVVALVVALMWHSSPAALVFAGLLGLAAILACPSPP